MYVLYKSKNILTLVTIGYIVGFIVGMYVEYCYGPKWPYWIYIAYIGLFGTGICRYYFWVELPVQRRLCPIFLKWRRVTRPPLVFRGLTGSQRTPGFWGVTGTSDGRIWKWQGSKHGWKEFAITSPFKYKIFF